VRAISFWPVCGVVGRNKSLRLHKIKAHEKLGFYFLGGMRTRKEGSNYLVPACVRGFGTEQIPPAPKFVNKTYQNPINSTIYRVLSFKSPSHYSLFPNCSETLARP